MKQKTCDDGLRLIIKQIRKVFPEVSVKLEKYIKSCALNGDRFLMNQAVSSIETKKFHCQGGGVFSLYPGVNREKALGFIISLQTISDYLDNLCDRAGIMDETAFRQLHLAMLDAVDPNRQISQYYKYYPSANDGGYLAKLVGECRESIREVPSYGIVADKIKKYVRLYSDLQAYKHIWPADRERCLRTWAGYYMKNLQEISWYEFSAAAGSTLAIFALYAAAFDPELKAEDAASLESAYFPWICGLHILLDYYIDSREDFMTGDLNFTSYYDNLKQCETRIKYFYQQSIKHCETLSNSSFHSTVVEGLLAMYLSDSKALWGFNRLCSRNILKDCSRSTGLYYNLCRILRFAGAL